MVGATALISFLAVICGLADAKATLQLRSDDGKVFVLDSNAQTRKQLFSTAENWILSAASTQHLELVRGDESIARKVQECFLEEGRVPPGFEVMPAKKSAKGTCAQYFQVTAEDTAEGDRIVFRAPCVDLSDLAITFRVASDELRDDHEKIFKAVTLIGRMRPLKPVLEKKRFVAPDALIFRKRTRGVFILRVNWKSNCAELDDKSPWSIRFFAGVPKGDSIRILTPNSKALEASRALPAKTVSASLDTEMPKKDEVPVLAF
eukprot:Polyplicarium_translucidae@DN1698_c0_g1_i1.p1